MDNGGLTSAMFKMMDNVGTGNPAGAEQAMTAIRQATDMLNDNLAGLPQEKAASLKNAIAIIENEVLGSDMEEGL